MMPKIIEHKYMGEVCFWLSSAGRIGASLRCSLLDIEMVSPPQIERSLEIFFKQLPEELFVKWHLFSDVTHESHSGFARSQAITKIGLTRAYLLVHFEIKTTASANFKKTIKAKNSPNSNDFFDQGCEKLKSLLPISEFQSLGFNPQAVTTEELEHLFPTSKQPLVYRAFGVDNGLEYIGILKLVKLGKYELTYATISEIKDQIPQPYEVIVHHKKLPSALTELRLGQITKRESSPKNFADAEKAAESQAAQRNVELKGEQHYGFEMHILFRRLNEESIKVAQKEALRALANIGDFVIESIGAEPSYVSTLPGTPFHFAGTFEALTEEHQKLPCYLPLFTRGSPDSVHNHPGALAFHRMDFSVDYYSPFDRRYQNYCSMIVGQSGTGKSVLLNRIIASALNSPSAKLVIVDVRGSHTRLVKSLGGKLKNINLTQASGINPFAYLKRDTSEYTQSVIAAFLSELMLEEEEIKLTDAESFDLTRAISDYIDSKPGDPNLNDFIKGLSETFPRKKLLMRFSEKGLFKHIFSKSPTKETVSNLTYYNFESIDLAANRSVVRAIMSAIMAEVNALIKWKNKGEEVLFICDETPFFVELCFNSFKFLNKNMRKEMGALILTVQVSSHLVVRGDDSLISGSGTKILLSYDGDKKAFESRLELDPNEAEVVFQINGVKGEYSQFLIKDKLGSRIGNLFITAQEYWQSTTEDYDNARIIMLQKQFSQIPEDTLLSLLSIERDLNKVPKQILLQEAP